MGIGSADSGLPLLHSSSNRQASHGVRKGVVRNHRHPPGSAITREGNLWGESGQSGFLTGQNIHRLTRGVTVISYSPLPYFVFQSILLAEV
jgi:hypothetical protein